MQMPKDTSRLLYLCVLATVCAIYAAMEQLTPPLFDNIGFDAIYMQFNNGSDTFDVAGFARYADHLRANDNWRMANLLAPLTTLVFPCKLLFSLLCGICVAYIVHAAAAGFGRRGRVAAAVAAWAGITIFLPWRNNILVNDYALNYIFPAALTLLVLRMACTQLREAARGRAIALVLLAALAAIWHEGFAVTAGAALAFYIVVFRRYHASASVWAAAALLAVGGMAWALSSALYSRVGEEIVCPSIVESPAKALANNALTLILLAAFTASVAIRPLRRVLARAAVNPFFAICFLSAMAGCALSFAVRLEGRTAFWPETCAVVAGVLWARELWRPRYRRLTYVLTACLYAALAAHGCYAAAYVAHSAREYERIMDEMHRAAADATIYTDVTMPEQYPAATLGLPVRNVFLDPFSFIVLDVRYPERRVAVVPSALRAIGSATPETLGCAMRIGNALFCDTVAGESGMRRARLAATDLRMRDGSVRLAQRTFVLRFTAPDGRQYLYLKPYKLSATDAAEITKITRLPY